MILKENYEAQHIRDLQAASKGDPGLIERTLYALGLLETPFVKSLDMDSLRAENLSQKDLLTMKAFRKTRSDNYGYLVLADRLLREYR